MDVYLRSNVDKLELLSLRSQADKIITSVTPIDLTLSPIVLSNATTSKTAVLNNLLFDNIILSETTGRALGTAKPTDLILSSIILSQTKKTGGIAIPICISINMSTASTKINMEAC